MNFIELGFKHSKIVLLLMAAVTVLGVIFAFLLPVHFFPDIPTSYFITQTTALGATSKEIDQQITLPFLKAYQTLPSLLSLQGVSNIGYSRVDVQFEMSPKIDQLIGQGYDRFNSVRHDMPDFASAPIFHRVMLADEPVLWVGVQNKQLNREALTRLTNKAIIPSIESMPGVNAVTLEGAVVPEVKVYLDPSKMSALKLNMSDIVTAFDSDNFMLPAGFVSHYANRYPLDFDMKIKSMQGLRSMIIKQYKGHVVRLQDVADVVMGTALPKSVVQVNGEPAVGLAISTLPGANVLNVVPEIIKNLQTDVMSVLPKGTKISVPHNESTLVGEMLDGLDDAVIYSLIFACLIVLIFTQSFRMTWIVITTIPASLAAAVCGLYFFGYSFNVVTLMSFSLLVGVAVDDSIVVIENMHKHVDFKSDVPIKTQCIEATKRISIPVFTTTLTIAALAFSALAMSGQMKVMFGSFATVLVVGVIASYIIAMCSKPYLYSIYMARSKPSRHRIAEAIRFWIKTIENQYYTSLKYAIKYRHYIMALLVVLLVCTGFVGRSIGFDLMPHHIDYAGIDVSYWVPENSAYQSNLKKLNEIEKIIRSTGDAQATYSKAGFEHLANQGSIYVLLKPSRERKKTADEIIEQLRENLQVVPGVRFKVKGAISQREALSFAVVGSRLDEVERSAKALLRKLNAHQELGRFSSDFRPDQIQYRLDVNKELAGARGITNKQIAQLSALFGGEINVGTYAPDDLNELNNSKPIDIKLFPKAGTLMNLHDLDKIYLRTPSGSPLILSSIAKFTRVSEPSMVVRVGNQYGVRFWASPSVSLSNAMTTVRDLAKPLLPSGCKIISLGSTKASLRSIKSMRRGVLLLLCVFYIIFAAQFNSLVQPLIILVSQPLALVGAIFGLAIFNMTISLYAMIGIVLLIGLVAKNSILIVDRANQLVNKQEDWVEGLFLGCKERLTPIVMTSLTIVLAMVPVYFSFGQPARGEDVLATTIISGMLFSTVLSLYIVPILYFYLHSNKTKGVGECES